MLRYGVTSKRRKMQANFSKKKKCFFFAYHNRKLFNTNQILHAVLCAVSDQTSPNEYKYKSIVKLFLLRQTFYKLDNYKNFCYSELFITSFLFYFFLYIFLDNQINYYNYETLKIGLNAVLPVCLRLPSTPNDLATL